MINIIAYHNHRLEDTLIESIHKYSSFSGKMFSEASYQNDQIIVINEVFIISRKDNNRLRSLQSITIL